MGKKSMNWTYHTDKQQCTCIQSSKGLVNKCKMFSNVLYMCLVKHMKIGNKIETIFGIRNFISFKIKQMLNNKFINLWW